jgi:antitoxin (DNA-binding transcriptional repressor) of toxin-antitoxin stability system
MADGLDRTGANALPGPKWSFRMPKMDISVTLFKQQCLEIIRRVEKTGRPVAITRRGRVVAQLRRPAPPGHGTEARPWERLRALGGRLLAAPGESVVSDKDFEALR